MDCVNNRYPLVLISETSKNFIWLFAVTRAFSFAQTYPRIIMRIITPESVCHDRPCPDRPSESYWSVNGRV